MKPATALEKRQCSACGEFKSQADYYARPDRPAGFSSACKVCVKLRARRSRGAHPERARAFDRERNQTSERKELRAKVSGDYVASHPERAAAYTAVKVALDAGRLTKQPCAFCRSIENLEAHHHDYSKPLDVTWLCKSCHRRFHGLERMATYRV